MQSVAAVRFNPLVGPKIALDLTVHVMILRKHPQPSLLSQCYLFIFIQACLSTSGRISVYKCVGIQHELNL